MTRNIKSEHSGAKNGGGYWGKREEAKELSNIKRRQDSKEISLRDLEEFELEHDLKYPTKQKSEVS